MAKEAGGKRESPGQMALREAVEKIHHEGFSDFGEAMKKLLSIARKDILIYQALMKKFEKQVAREALMKLDPARESKEEAMLAELEARDMDPAEKARSMARLSVAFALRR